MRPAALLVVFAACGDGGPAASDAPRAPDGAPRADAPPAAATRYLKAAFADPADRFGAAVALSADGLTLAIGAPGESSAAVGVGGNPQDENADQAGAVYVFVRATTDARAWTQQAYVKASDTAIGAHFGASVALGPDGAQLVVGAPDAADHGQAYEYARTGATWAQVGAPLAPAASTAGAKFGAAVGCDGAILVGAPGIGTAYRFAGTPRVATPVQAAGASDLGASVAIAGTTLVAGAPAADTVYALRLEGAQYVAHPIVTAETRIGDHFGAAVALDAQRALAVGAPDRDGRGAAYLFTDPGTGDFALAHELVAPNGDPDDRFGASIALGGGLVVVGAPHEAGTGTDRAGDPATNADVGAGAAYVFAVTGALAADGYLKATNTDPNDAFGTAVAIDRAHTAILAGAPGEASKTGDAANNSAPNAGAAYLY